MKTRHLWITGAALGFMVFSAGAQAHSPRHGHGWRAGPPAHGHARHFNRGRHYGHYRGHGRRSRHHRHGHDRGYRHHHHAYGPRLRHTARRVHGDYGVHLWLDGLHLQWHDH